MLRAYLLDFRVTQSTTHKKLNNIFQQLSVNWLTVLIVLKLLGKVFAHTILYFCVERYLENSTRQLVKLLTTLVSNVVLTDVIKQCTMHLCKQGKAVPDSQKRLSL